METDQPAAETKEGQLHQSKKAKGRGRRDEEEEGADDGYHLKVKVRTLDMTASEPEDSRGKE